MELDDKLCSGGGGGVQSVGSDLARLASPLVDELDSATTTTPESGAVSDVFNLSGALFASPENIGNSFKINILITILLHIIIFKICHFYEKL